MNRVHAAKLAALIARDVDLLQYDQQLIVSVTKLLEHIVSTVCEQPVQVAFTSQMHNGKTLALSADLG